MKAHISGYENMWEETFIYRLEVDTKKEICVDKIEEPID